MIKKERKSNYELLRLVAMMMVLIVHANFVSLKAPSPSWMLSGHELAGTVRYIVEALAMPAVDTFVLLSGFFTIKLSGERLLRYLFQIFFISVIVYFTTLLTNDFGKLSHNFLINCIPCRADWFAQCYLLLMLFAPVMNAFLDKISTKSLLKFVIAFFLIETAGGWLTDAFSTTFRSGYSVVSFIGLYLLGALLRRKIHLFKHSHWRYLAYWITSAIIVGSFTALITMRMPESKIERFMLAYSSPIVIMQAACLLIAFSRIELKSTFVNKIAGSAFAVYLFHANPLMMKNFTRICRELYNNHDTVSYIPLVAIYLICIFVISILIDLMRKATWQQFTNVAQYIRQRVQARPKQ